MYKKWNVSFEDAPQWMVYHIFQDLLNAMEKRGLHFKEMARRMKLSEGQVATMFSCQRNMTLSTLGKVIHALNMHPKEVLVSLVGDENDE